jgi:hypothetical protein
VRERPAEEHRSGCDRDNASAHESTSHPTDIGAEARVLHVMVRSSPGNQPFTRMRDPTRMCIDATLMEPGSASSSETTSRTIATTLAKFGSGAVAFALRSGIRITPLRIAQRYRDASPSLRRLGVDVDTWPVPPAGLFVVEERTVYLRTPTPMTIAHEFSHAIDCALGGGVYRSGYDPQIRAAFANARSFVTPYAATGLDEYFAESMRAYVGVNDRISPWPAATRVRLAAIDPAMHACLARIFALDLGEIALHT